MKDQENWTTHQTEKLKEGKLWSEQHLQIGSKIDNWKNLEEHDNRNVTIPRPIGSKKQKIGEEMKEEIRKLDELGNRNDERLENRRVWTLKTEELRHEGTEKWNTWKTGKMCERSMNWKLNEKCKELHELLQDVLGLEKIAEMLHKQTGRLLKTSNLNSTANSTENQGEVKLRDGQTLKGSTNEQTLKRKRRTAPWQGDHNQKKKFKWQTFQHQWIQNQVEKETERVKHVGKQHDNETENNEGAKERTSKIGKSTISENLESKRTSEEVNKWKTNGIKRKLDIENWKERRHSLLHYVHITIYNINTHAHAKGH